MTLSKKLHEIVQAVGADEAAGYCFRPNGILRPYLLGIVKDRGY
jgi:hypothetical protein